LLIDGVEIMVAVVMQIGAVWLASSLVVGVVVGKLLKNSNEEMERANLMQPEIQPQMAVPQSKAG
jgi:hypothetical protein